MKIALLYDFDKTLSYKDMQEYGFFDDLKIEDSKSFWGHVKAKAEKEDMDHILTYLHEMIVQTQIRNIKLSREMLGKYGSQIEFYPGVIEWFEHINKVAQSYNIELEHYIISSGLREMISGTAIAKHFKEIFASAFYYDHNGIAIWPSLAINYTTKTQYLFRINKGCLDINDNEGINKYTPDNKRRIPWTNMVYIGDGLTDIPCFKLVKDKGGHSIAVYKPKTKRTKNQTLKLIEDNRVNFAVQADYKCGSKLEKIVKYLIDKIKIDNCIYSIK